MTPENRLYRGDNLAIMRQYLTDECVDLVYLDPPFNSHATYRLPESQKTEAFGDIWRWDGGAATAYEDVMAADGHSSRALRALRIVLGDSEMMAYLTMMTPRLLELHRVLKASGSLYLHCDPTASHYLKILLDAIFGVENFRNELIWYYGGRGAKAVARQFPRNHDVILLYSKQNSSPVYRRQHTSRAFTAADARRHGFRQDESGRWFKTAPRGDYTAASVERLEAAGRIHRTRSGGMRVKYFLEEEAGRIVEDALVGDVWLDIPDAMHIGKERLGYPTQKPEALLERIIRAGSDEDDMVLDPFAGCGTAIAVAERLRRRWIGIDNVEVAIKLIEARLRDRRPEAIYRSL